MIPNITRTIHKGLATQALYYFDNHYGASVVQGLHSYGGDTGLYELAVLKLNPNDHDDWDITYDTPVTSDVMGYLSESEVYDILIQIAALPIRGQHDNIP